MSIATWEKQYYPTPAEKCSKAKALDHSIRKWTGATPAALKHHGLTKGSYCCIKDSRGDDFVFGSKTCSLCCTADCGLDTNQCPIYTVTGHGCIGLLNIWAHMGDAKPMLTLLRKVKREMAKKGKK